MKSNGMTIDKIIEAIIFASPEPISEGRIKDCIEGTEDLDVDSKVNELNDEYEKNGRSFRIINVAGGYQMTTLPDYEQWVRRVFVSRGRLRLSAQALETLSIVAYRQPVSKPTMESIRGISCDGVIKTLLERTLITIKGREDSPGRPILYGTTNEFLRYFGLINLKDLPKLKEIEEIIGAVED
ncbi:MAG: SMC-Scp complex subunit ScpB [Candidatus Marinimicrobia bacterium]|nr:SMC-Scp complex subunit ScpB [Candidatus Neomarinimicrobiota bacterium]